MPRHYDEFATDGSDHDIIMSNRPHIYHNLILANVSEMIRHSRVEGSLKAAKATFTIHQ